MEVTKIFSVDICRDGGSYSLSFESNDKEWYEFFVQVKGVESNEYHEPSLYKRGVNDGELIQTLTWVSAKSFLSSLKYDSSRFTELKRLIESNGIT
ncbi:MAG: hypothetical protein V7765_21830 [Oleispira sp.]